MTRLLQVPWQLSADQPSEPVTRSRRVGLRTWLDENNLDDLSAALQGLPTSEATAADVLSLLADPRLTPQLRDGAGRAVRAVAVAALLRLGFPHALQVDPEDLALLREAERQAGGTVVRWVLGALSLVPAALLVGVAPLLPSMPSPFAFDAKGVAPELLLVWLAAALPIGWCSWGTVRALSTADSRAGLARAARRWLSVYAAGVVAGAGAGSLMFAVCLPFWSSFAVGALWLSPLLVAMAAALGGSRLMAPPVTSTRLMAADPASLPGHQRSPST